MTARFPDIPLFHGGGAPSRVEADIGNLEIEGELPAALAGIYHRVQPDPYFPPRMERDIFFNGDGMAAMFHFQNGRVSFKQRYVRTAKLEAERAAGRALFGAYRNPFSDDASVAHINRTTANTNVLLHGGVLLAMKEDGPPYALDPYTLETIGMWDFYGKLTSRTFTAHPKRDARTGELHAFGYSASGECTPDIAYYVIDKSGRITREVWIEAPYHSLVHDFWITEDFVVFPIVPYVGSVEWLKQGKPRWFWDPRKEMYLGVLPRNGEAKDIRWVRDRSRYSTHVFNGFNVGGKLYLDTPALEQSPLPFFPDITGNVFVPEQAQSRISRWVVDFDKPENGFEDIWLQPMICEFSRVDDRFIGQPYRHCYMSSLDVTKPWDMARNGPRSEGFNTVAHFDIATSRLTQFYVGDDSTLQEVQFAPRAPDAPEGDGWLMAVVQRHTERRSDLIILDAQNIEDGPIAIARLPLRIRNGLHGNWTPAWDLPPQSGRSI